MKRRVPDSKRFSIIHDMDSCYFCGGVPVDIHEIFHGTANRQKSIQNGLCLGLCRFHHEAVHRNKQLDLKLKQIGKKAFLRDHSEEEFMEIFGRAYEDIG